MNCVSTCHNSDKSLRTGDIPGVWRRANGLPISCKLADWTTWSSCIWNAFPLKFSSQVFIPRLLGSQFVTKRNNWRFLYNTEKGKNTQTKTSPIWSLNLVVYLLLVKLALFRYFSFSFSKDLFIPFLTYFWTSAVLSAQNEVGEM